MRACSGQCRVGARLTGLNTGWLRVGWLRAGHSVSIARMMQADTGASLARIAAALLSRYCLAPVLMVTQALPVMLMLGVTIATVAAMPGFVMHANAANTDAPIIARQAAITTKGKRTVFSLHLSRPLGVQVFTLADPYRVIIDIANVQFRLPNKNHSRGKGVIKAYRYGLFAPGKSRIVLDVGGPIVVRKSQVRRKGRNKGAILSIEIEPTDEIGFLLKPPPRQAAKRRIAEILNRLRGSRDQNRSRPVVVIDPGHGGVDAGTVGVGSSYEKTVTIAVARRLVRILNRSKRYKVLLTRKSDTFVSLDERVEFSRKHHANLFISIHADAIADKIAAKSVRGGTIYTLSESASDEQARQLAAKENAVDILAGVETRLGKKAYQVKNILIDLLRRETANYSIDFSNLLIKHFRGRIKLHGKKHKSAAFYVLKQPQVPSVLIELGYMSNPSDEKLLKSTKWQLKLARAVARSVDGFFARQLAGSR